MLGLDTLLKQAIFGLYVLLWVSCHLLVYHSKHNSPAYNSTSVVLITEIVKLIMAACLYLSYDGGPSVLIRSATASLPLLAKYSIPALLYCIYNNLVYMNLTFFDPGTYNVLMQLRIIMTGLLYQVYRRTSRTHTVAVSTAIPLVRSSFSRRDSIRTNGWRSCSSLWGACSRKRAN